MPPNSEGRAGSGATRAGPDEEDTGGDRETAEHRWERNRLFLLDRGLERAEIDDLLAGGVRDALVGEGDDPQNDQNDTDERKRFHTLHPLPRSQRNTLRSWRARAGRAAAASRRRACGRSSRRAAAARAPRTRD